MISASIREVVRRRAGNRCEYCRLPQDAVRYRPLHIEHIVAQQHGGTSAEDNLALACAQCNLYKGPNLTSIDPYTTQVIRLFNPRQDNWDAHFAINGPRIEGRTSIGRATARLLQMNKRDRVEFRQSLIDERGSF